MIINNNFYADVICKQPHLFIVPCKIKLLTLERSLKCANLICVQMQNYFLHIYFLIMQHDPYKMQYQPSNSNTSAAKDNTSQQTNNAIQLWSIKVS